MNPRSKLLGFFAPGRQAQSRKNTFCQHSFELLVSEGKHKVQKNTFQPKVEIPWIFRPGWASTRLKKVLFDPNVDKSIDFFPNMVLDQLACPIGPTRLGWRHLSDCSPRPITRLALPDWARLGPTGTDWPIGTDWDRLEPIGTDWD